MKYVIKCDGCGASGTINTTLRVSFEVLKEELRLIDSTGRPVVCSACGDYFTQYYLSQVVCRNCKLHEGEDAS